MSLFIRGRTELKSRPDGQPVASQNRQRFGNEPRNTQNESTAPESNFIPFLKCHNVSIYPKLAIDVFIPYDLPRKIASLSHCYIQITRKVLQTIMMWAAHISASSQTQVGNVLTPLSELFEVMQLFGVTLQREWITRCEKWRKFIKAGRNDCIRVWIFVQLTACICFQIH